MKKRPKHQRGKRCNPKRSVYSNGPVKLQGPSDSETLLNGKSHRKPGVRQVTRAAEITAESWRSLFASDSFWQLMLAFYEELPLLLDLRPKLQPLAKQYCGRPREFVSAWDQLLNRVAKKHGVPQAELRSLDELFRPTQRLSRRQIKAMKDGSEILSSAVDPRGKPKVPPKSIGTSVVGTLRAFISDPPGPKPRPRTVEIQRLHLKGLRPAKIARMVYPQYTRAASLDKQQMIDEVRTVIKNMRRT